LQAGGHRFDPGQLHQNLIRCFPIAAISVAAIWMQAGPCNGWVRQVSTASGRAFPIKSGRVWMFDNKIDWVTRLECRCARREARSMANDFKHVKYKAEHMQ
jgi:hypothetical protein